MFWDGARSRTGRVPEQFCVPEQSKRFWNADLFQNGSVPEHPLFWNAPAVPERGGDVPDAVWACARACVARAYTVSYTDYTTVYCTVEYYSLL